MGYRTASLLAGVGIAEPVRLELDRAAGRLRTVLVTGEIAVCVVLLPVDMGMATEELAFVTVDLR